MSGALTERVFVKKLERVGFADVAITDRFPFGLTRAVRYPLFTPDLVDLMYDLIPEERQDEVAVSVVVQAVKPS